MTPKLQAIIAEAYDTFARYKLAAPLTVCHCDCCMSDDTERALLTTPLQIIASELLAEYTNSAHGWDDAVAREMRHFLPRYLELIALYDPPDHLGLDICLRRLAYANWRNTWPRTETALLDMFFDELLVASLPRLELSLWPVGWRLTFDLVDILTLGITADGDIERMLAAWDVAADPAAAIHMAALRSNLSMRRERPYLHSAFLADKDSHIAAADAIGAFLVRRQVTARIEAAILAVDDPRLQQILSDARG